MRPVDMPIRTPLLRRFVGLAGARVVLPAAVYELIAVGGQLMIAAGVTLVGQEGVALAGYYARLVVESEGVSFESMHLPLGVMIREGGLTMKKCTSTGQEISVQEGASLVMEDTRTFGSSGFGVTCLGDVKATRCTVEDNGHTGVYVDGEEASAELVDFVIRKNGQHGVYVYESKVVLRGGMISENKLQGVDAFSGGKVTVAKAEEGKPQTVSKDNDEGHDWAAAGDEIIGIPQEKINA